MNWLIAHCNFSDLDLIKIKSMENLELKVKNINLKIKVISIN